MFFQRYDYHHQHEYEFLENNVLLTISLNRIQSSLVSSLWCRALDESADLTSTVGNALLTKDMLPCDGGEDHGGSPSKCQHGTWNSVEKPSTSRKLDLSSF
jgi:hypothetical protein